MATCPQGPLPFALPRMRYLSDLRTEIRLKHGPLDQLPPEERYYVNNTERIFEQATKVNDGAPIECIHIEDLITHSKEILDSIGSNPTTRWRYRLTVDRMLAEAYSTGHWTCRAYEVRLSWLLIYDWVRNKDLAVKQMIDYAVANGIFRNEYADEHYKEWIAWKKRQARKGRRLSANTADAEAATFLAALRHGGFQDLFPRLTLARSAPDYVLADPNAQPTPANEERKKMPAEINQQIQGFGTWATATGPLEFRKCEITAQTLVVYLRQLASFVIDILGITGITDIREVIVESYVDYWVDFLFQRDCGSRSVIEMLRTIRALTKQHELFKTGDYSWLDRKKQSILVEPKWKRRERTRQKLVAPALVATIPEKIQADRQTIPDLSPEEIARSKHDQLFFSLPCWRSSVYRGLSMSIHIEEKKMTDFIHSKLLCCPAWLDEERHLNPDREYIVVHLYEEDEKNRIESYEMLEGKTEALYRDCMTERHLLVRGEDKGTVFLSKWGTPMSAAAIRSLTRRITSQYLPKPLSNHRRRNCNAIAAIVAGATIGQICERLHQVSGESPETYISGRPCAGSTSTHEQEVKDLAAKCGLVLS